MDMTSEELDARLRELRQASRCLVEQSKAINAIADFVLKNLPASEDPSGSGLMKFVKQTWMPIEESRFTEAVDQNGGYQSKSYLAALRHTRGKALALDIGANIGLWARPMARDFRIVHCFEPQWLARACLVRNVPTSNVVLWPFALDEVSREAELSVPHVGVGAAMIGPPAAAEAFWSQIGSHREAVQTVTLDSLNFSGVDLIKIDVQGYEAKVLRGAVDTIRRCSPTIVCEAGGKLESYVNVEEPIELLADLGYRIAERIGKDVVMVPCP